MAEVTALPPAAAGAAPAETQVEQRIFGDVGDDFYGHFRTQEAAQEDSVPEEENAEPPTALADEAIDLNLTPRTEAAEDADDDEAQIWAFAAPSALPVAERRNLTLPNEHILLVPLGWQVTHSYYDCCVANFYIESPTGSIIILRAADPVAADSINGEYADTAEIAVSQQATYFATRNGQSFLYFTKHGLDFVISTEHDYQDLFTLAEFFLQ
jgi:hypothetical protein